LTHGQSQSGDRAIQFDKAPLSRQIFNVIRLDTPDDRKERSLVSRTPESLTAFRRFDLLAPVKVLHIVLITVAAVGMTTLTGCSLLTTTASPNSNAVSEGLATTNDLAAVAALREAQAVNKAVNPTQTEPLIDAGLGGLAMMLTAFGGWYARHTTAKAQIEAATTNPPKP
jgi:hypothetical protein